MPPSARIENERYELEMIGIESVFACALWCTSFALYSSFLLGILLLATLIFQYFEYGVLSTLKRSKWGQPKQTSELRIGLHQAFWATTMVSILVLMLWMYFTERWGGRMWYATAFFWGWEGLQFLLAASLTSWEDTKAAIDRALHQPWIKRIRARLM